MRLIRLRRRWASGSKAARATPKGAHSNSPGLAAPARFYVCGLQACPLRFAFMLNPE
jgi:hypothetical protein